MITEYLCAEKRNILYKLNGVSLKERNIYYFKLLKTLHIC